MGFSSTFHMDQIHSYIIIIPKQKIQIQVRDPQILNIILNKTMDSKDDKLEKVIPLLEENSNQRLTIDKYFRSSSNQFKQNWWGTQRRIHGSILGTSNSTPAAKSQLALAVKLFWSPSPRSIHKLRIKSTTITTAGTNYFFFVLNTFMTLLSPYS